MTYYIDTNYFLRFFLDDNKKQSKKVKDLFIRGSNGEVKLITSIVVFLEIHWVLTSAYKFPKEKILKALNAILEFDFIKTDNEKAITSALEIYKRNNIDIEDCFHLAETLSHKNNCKLATFDKKLIKVADKYKKS